MSSFELTDWEDELDLKIIALASHLEDYQLAYSLNKELGILLTNRPELLTIKKNKQNFQFSIYSSKPKSDVPTVYLIDNQSVQAEQISNSGSLFNNSFLYQQTLISTLKKWHYLVVFVDGIWTKNLLTLNQNKNILYTQAVDIKLLTKQEQAIITSLTYDEQH